VDQEQNHKGPFARIKQYFFRRSLIKRLSKLRADRETVRLSRARSVGMLFNATRPEHIVQVNGMVDKLTKMGIKVEPMGFIARKENGTATHHFSFISLRDLNWFGVPAEHKVSGFMNKRYDLLINAWLEPCPPLDWIACLSTARFRVGPWGESAERQDAADFLIRLRDEQRDLDAYFEQVLHFMNMLEGHAPSSNNTQAHEHRPQAV
jgi:hypothetical protein